MEATVEITAAVQNVPALRFPEFEGDWKEVRMQGLQIDGYDITYGILKPEEFVVGGIAMLQIKDILHNKADLTNLHLISDKLHKQYKRTVIDENDIVLSVVGTIGRVAKIPGTLKGMNIHRNLALLKINHHSSSDFIYQILISSKVQREIDKKVIGSTQQLYNLKDLRNLEFCLPSLQEQQKIASFLSVADDKIQQLSKKKELLERYKKGVMQQIFSQQIRFKDDNGNDFPEWEEKRLGNYLIKHDEKSTETNQYPVLTSARTGLHFQKDYYSGNEVASTDSTGYNVVPRGYFTYRHMSDDLIFKFNINDLCDKGIVSTLYPVFTTNEKLDSKFLRYKLNEGNEFKNYAILQKQGGSRTYMYYNKLENLKLMLPIFEEQKKITCFLSTFDSKIYLIDKQLEQAQQFKKGLLQQMFV